jgi:hypothetical protein
MRKGRRILEFAAFMVLFSAIAMAHEPIRVTPCELAVNPPAYDGKMITVRSVVRIGFENSSLEDESCKNVDTTSIWVTFGGDVEMPITYCCGNHKRKSRTSLTIDGVKLSLKKDAQFERYMRLLTAVRKQAPPGVPCFYDCYQHSVKADLTGHFFAGTEWRRPESGKVLYVGYGHLGCCSLFVIEKVGDIESHATQIPVGDNFQCQNLSWLLHIDRTATKVQQQAGQGNLLQQPDIESLGLKLVKERMKNFDDDFVQGDTSSEYEGIFEKEKEARYIWLSKDKLTSYKVSFKRLDWLSLDANKVDARPWIPVKIERSACKPRN